MNTPIVLFVYNRPEHTKQTVDALKNNHLTDFLSYAYPTGYLRKKEEDYRV